MLKLMPTCAVAGIGTATTNAKSIAPKSNLFMSLPPSEMVKLRMTDAALANALQILCHQIHHNKIRKYL
jgi:hypothetical protein